MPPAAAEPRHGIPRDPGSILQVSNTFLICSVDGGMLVVDQHSAHERINYERLRARFERDGRNTDVQPLMFPEPLRLDASGVALLEEMQPFLERLGFELSPAGPREMLVQAVPAALGDRSVTKALEGLMEAYSESRSLGLRSEEVAEGITPVEDRLLMTMACHAAVKAGQPLSEPEIRALWKDLVERGPRLSRRSRPPRRPPPPRRRDRPAPGPIRCEVLSAGRGVRPAPRLRCGAPARDWTGSSVPTPRSAAHPRST